MIKIICVGKLKEKYLTDGVNDYLTRLRKYHKIDLIELADSNIDNEGTELSSPELADKIDKTFISNPNITFIIGGSNGIRQDILDKSNLLLSFSKLTYPHGLFRLILLEQIYRSYRIMKGEPYHK